MPSGVQLHGAYPRRPSNERPVHCVWGTEGGIDPAGFDEHWKTASTALERIRDAFSARGLSPHSFFVGAGIAADMADELWQQLEDGKLTNAANLTKGDQLASLCQWLVGL